MTDDLPRDRVAAIEALFRLQAASLLEVASLLVGNEVAAQQVVLDAFADVYARRRYRDSFAATDALRAAVLRGSRRLEPDPEAILAPLTRRQREVFVLLWWLGLSVQETGELLRMSPRAVSRIFAEARAVLPADEQLAEAVDAQTAELSYDALDELRQRISGARARTRRRMGVGLTAAVLVVGALAPTLWATRSRPYTSPSGRPVFAAVIPVAELATFDVITGKPRGNVIFGLAEAVASLPGDGWLVARLDSQCRSILTTIAPDGSTRRVGGLFDGELSNLAVSPDGRYAAGVASLCGSAPVLRLDVVDLRTGRLVSGWAPPPRTTTISGLSWAPDSRRLVYTLGSGLGGHGSGYALLDTGATGEQLGPVATTSREVVVGRRSCPVVRSLWLGRSGRFAVFAACVDRNELLVTRVAPRPDAVQRGAVLATLPDSALTLGLDAVSTEDGRHLLVTTDVATYRVDGAKVTRLADSRPSPAW